MYSAVRRWYWLVIFCLLTDPWQITLAQGPTYIPFKAEFSDKINNVRDIYRDSLGFIWLSTNYGVVRIDGKKATRLTKFNSSFIKSNSFLHMVRIPFVNKYYFHDELGNFLTLDGAGGLTSDMETEFSIRSYLRGNAELDVIRHMSEFQIMPNGECIALQLGGEVVYFKQGKNSWQGVPIPFQMKGRNLVNLSGEFFLSSRGKIGKITSSGLLETSVNGLIEADALKDVKLFADNYDNGFIISQGRLYRCSYRQNTFYAEKINGIENLSDVSAVMEDPITGHIYIGSFSNDLLIFQIKRFDNLFAESNLEGGSLYSYTPLSIKNGEYFFMSEGNLYRWSGSSREEVFKGSNLAVIWSDSLKGIWFSTEANQIYRLFPEGSKSKAELITTLDTEVRQIGMASGTFFILTNSSLYQFEGIPGRPLKIQKQFKLFEKLNPNTRASQVYFEDNRFGLVAHRDGLIKLDLKTGEVKLIDDLKGVNIRNLTNVPGLGLLAGTYGDGFFLIRGERAIKMPMDENGVMEAIHAFIPDSFGNIWMPTNKGLIKVRLIDLQDYILDKRARPLFELFTEKDGLYSSEFNGGTNPAFTTDGQYIILPSAKGLVRFSPADFVRQNEPVVVPRMVKDGQFSVIPSLLSLNSGESFEVQFDEVAGPSLYNNKIWYKILPSETSWKFVDASERITLENLLPGTYKIEFLPRSPYGPEAKQTQTFSFTVKPRWYQTSIIYGITAIIIFLIIWLFIRVRLYVIQQNQKRLQVEIASKTAQLNQVNLELSKTNLELSNSMEIIEGQIKFKEKVLLVLLHDLKSPMRFVTSSLRSLFTDLESSSPHKKLSGELVMSLTRIYKFMEDFQNWVLQSETGINKPEFVSINQMLESIWEFYQQPAAVYGNKILVNSEDLVIKTYSFTLKTIIGNLVDNSVKNTRDGEVNLIAYDTLSFINIEVSDNGSGMAKEILDGVLHIIDSREKIKMPSMGSGVGYRLIGEFISTVDGLISLESEPGKGTKVVVSIRK